MARLCRICFAALCATSLRTASGQTPVTLPPIIKNAVPSVPPANLASAQRCVHPGIVYTTSFANEQQPNWRACQSACANQTGAAAGCVVFGYFESEQQCWYGPADNQLRVATNPSDAVGGYGICPMTSFPPPRCVSEVPIAGEFPGPSAEKSDAAWPSGRAPMSLECWPLDEKTSALMACKNHQVIEDEFTGWPGACFGLTKQEKVGHLCATDCARNPSCPSWQIGTDQNCWQGLGKNCYNRTDFQPFGAQRYLHGHVRVLMDMTGWQVWGLTQVFDAGAVHTPEKALTACKNICYSDIHCQFWSYTPTLGCWVEDVTNPSASVEYPLTLSTATRRTQNAERTIGGEYIQHYCPQDQAKMFIDRYMPPPPCIKLGVKCDPEDMPGLTKETGLSIEPHSLGCQQRCQKTDGCRFFQYSVSNGHCHLSAAQVCETPDTSYNSGPRECPVEAPAASALCSSKAACKDLAGACCPTTDGSYLECCRAQLPNTPGRLTLKMDFDHLQFGQQTKQEVETLKQAYASDLASCALVKPEQVMNLHSTPGTTSILPCPNDKIDGADCKTGMMMAAIVDTSPESVREIARRIESKSCAGNSPIFTAGSGPAGLVFNSTAITLRNHLASRSAATTEDAAIGAMTLVVSDDTLFSVGQKLTISNANYNTEPEHIEMLGRGSITLKTQLLNFWPAGSEIKEEQPEFVHIANIEGTADLPGGLPWYELWWVWLLIGVLSCLIGVILFLVCSEPKKRSLQLDEDESDGLLDLEDDYDVPQGDLPFPDRPLADRETIKQPIIPVPYPEAGYGTAVGEGYTGEVDYYAAPLTAEAQRYVQAHQTYQHHQQALNKTFK